MFYNQTRCLFSVGWFRFQFTEERFGQAEKTELDAHLENLLVRAENTKLWTERIMRQTEVLLQPNPSKKKPSCVPNTAVVLSETPHEGGGNTPNYSHWSAATTQMDD